VWLDASTAVAIECGGWIRRSTDGGLTWPLAGAGNSYAVSRVAFADASTGIAVDRNAHAVRTTDGGITWQDAPLPSTLVEPARPWFVSPTEGYIFGHHEPLYRTTDGGLTWTMEQVSRLDHMDGAGALASNLQEGVALDAQTSLVVGGHGVVMKRTP
jgi:photosystem II stability/assembly factor-like uncharacterized protein